MSRFLFVFSAGALSQAAKDVRSAPVAVCAVYGFTLSGACDSSVKVNTRQNQGQDYNTVRTGVTLKLTSDSLAQVKP